MFKRSLFNIILPQLQHKNAIVITGMRQVGKTTLMRQLFDAWEGRKLWYDFDNPLDYLLFENIDYHAVFDALRKSAGVKPEERFLVCIDEIQNFPDITRIIKFMIDHYKVKFIVTGSSNYYLRNLFPESLSGRKFLYILPVLSYTEYLYFNNRLEEADLLPVIEDSLLPRTGAAVYKNKDLYEEYLEYGGFPEVAITSDTETKKLILKNIFASFFEKDIKVFSELKDVRELRDLILLLAPRNGNMLDVSRLASELGINRVKVYSYLEFLEGTFFLRLLPKHTGSIDRSVAGGRKVYFSDTGILNLAAKVTRGQLLEVAVAGQLANYGQISFYNKRNTSEIDFILNGEIAFEVKHKATPADLQKLKKLATTLNINRNYVISNTPVEMERIVYPWFL
ncbi:MAG: ATP-binding protein [Lentimicrobium sp.]